MLILTLMLVVACLMEVKEMAVVETSLVLTAARWHLLQVSVLLFNAF